MTGQKFRSHWEQRFRSAGLARNRRDGMTDFAVGLILATWANPDGGSIFPGEQRLATDCGCSRSTITRSLARLRGYGWIKKVREGNSRNGKADEYRLALPESGSGVTDATQSQTDHASPAEDYESPTEFHASLAHDLRVTGAAPPIHRHTQEPQHNQHKEVTSLEVFANPWAGLGDRPIPPPAASGSGERQPAVKPEAEPPPAADRRNPWAGLGDRPIPPPAASGSGDTEGQGIAAAFEGPAGAYGVSADMNSDEEPPPAASGDYALDVPDSSAAAPSANADSVGYWAYKEQKRRQRLEDRAAGIPIHRYEGSWRSRSY